jgi:two-component system response regulator AtoC
MIERILVVDDERAFAKMLRAMLEDEGYTVETCHDGEAALERLLRESFDLVLSDVRMPKLGGMELLRALQDAGVDTTVIVMSAYGNIDTAIEAMKIGAYDYVAKPFKKDEVILTIRKLEERERLKGENEQLREAVRREYSFSNIIAKADSMMKLFRTIEKIASYKTTVLITGESGTGKELIARAIHFNSLRARRKFVPINCGAIPETLLESELFGYVRGAFTDAHKDKAGLFEEADGGTLFLDEIGELPLGLQVKLLRALQEEEIRRVGATQTRKVDVRIVAATVKDLGEACRQGQFREDLYYRLNVLPIHIPPLRERREDVQLLVEHFLESTNKRHREAGLALDRPVRSVTREALDLLLKYPWPGNVRELENTIERCIVLAEGDTITAETLPEKIRASTDTIRQTLQSGELSIKKTTRIIEEELIRRALKATRGNRTNAAKILEISHRALLYKLKEYGIS